MFIVQLMTVSGGFIHDTKFATAPNVGDILYLGQKPSYKRHTVVQRIMYENDQDIQIWVRGSEVEWNYEKPWWKFWA